jgi:type I restriction enzyme S subunit
MSEWKTYKLGEIAELRKEQVVPNGKEQPYIGLEHIEQQSLRLNGVGSSNSVISNKFKFYSGDILYGKLRPYFRKVYKPKFEGVCSTDIYVIKNKKLVDKDYLYYLVASEEFTNIANSGSSGTRMPRADWKQLEKSEWQLPDLPTQRQIAQILSSLDDKIELNLQMNQTLEAMAQAIFKEWFVHFNFPGFDGELVDGLPKGWRRGAIGELFKLTVGGDWGKEEFDNEFSENAFVVRGTDFDKILNGNISSVPNRFIKKPNLTKRKIDDGDILIEISGGSKDQPTGRTILFTDELLSLFNVSVVPASFCRLIRPLNFDYSLFLDVLFKFFYQIGGTWEYQNQSTGISNFQFTYFSENKKIALPDDEALIYNFSEVIRPIKKRIDKNIIQIQTLTQLRDTLLPKLMSGQIEIQA